MEKIRSGQSFLYRQNGYDSTVLEVCMKDKISGDFLEVALGKTVKRFPYMTQKLVEKEGCYFLHKNYNSLNAIPTSKIRSLGSMATGYHLIDVTFTKNIIRVAFHHALCDGRGIKPFVETLIYYYCCLKYKKIFSSVGIHTVDEKIKICETTEPIGEELLSFNESNVTIVDSTGFRIPEATATPKCCYRTAINLKENDFIIKAKEYCATPGILASILVSRSILKIHPEPDKPIVCGMAIDLRYAIGMEATHKNCTGSIYFPYRIEDKFLSMSKLASKYRSLLYAQKTVDSAKSKLNNQIKLFNMIDRMKTLEEKKQKLSFFEELAENTYVISYLGQMQFNDFGEYVESTYLYTQGIKGLTINMVAAGGKLSFDFLQGFEGERYVNAFLEELKDCGIVYEAEKTAIVTTANDKSYITASRQAERYFYKIK